MLESNLERYLPVEAKGKVRDIYATDKFRLLFVATDRISAYDVTMLNGIPSKGRVLNRMTHFWIVYLTTLLPNIRTHFVSTEIPWPLSATLPTSTLADLRGRTMHVDRLKVLPVEAIVRGYLTGSAWTEYNEKGTVHGMQVTGVDSGKDGKMKECEAFVKPIYTPSTKAKAGEKDRNIHPDEAAEILGLYAEKVKCLSLNIYKAAHRHAMSCGIILADAKFEFAADPWEFARGGDNYVYLVDEVLTPDCSRFWRADTYEPGRPQQSFDKQFLRDWLTENGLKGKEGVEMPEEVVRETAKRYREAFEMLVGKKWDEYGRDNFLAT